MKPYLYFIALVLVIPLLSPAAFASEWDGHYIYEADYGRSAGGSYIGGRYDIKLRAGASPACLISISGFQTDEQIICMAQEEAKKIILLFKSYASGSVKNIYGISVYSVGAPLLELESLPKQGKPTIRTTWRGLQSLDGKQKKPDIYFKKMNNGS